MISQALGPARLHGSGTAQRRAAWLVWGGDRTVLSPLNSAQPGWQDASQMLLPGMQEPVWLGGPEKNHPART